MTSAPSRSQRAFTVIGFLVVAGLTAGAFVLSYDALRLLALAGLEGRNADRFGRYYPLVYDGLVAIALLAVFVARHSPWWMRWVRWLVLFALVAGGVWASVQHALRGFEPVEGTALEAGVASAPWVAALLAIWLWMSMFRQLRPDTPRRHAAQGPGGRRASRAERSDDAAALIPGFVEEPAEDRPEHQTDPLPLPVFEQLPEPYREAVEAVAEPEEPREEIAAESAESAEPEPDDGPWDSPWPDGVRPDGGEGDAGDEDEQPAEPVRPPSSLPTDVKLVGRKEETARDESGGADPVSTTQPDFPVPGRRGRRGDAAQAADDWAVYPAEYDPPSGTLRSGPVPPKAG